MSIRSEKLSVAKATTANLKSILCGLNESKHNITHIPLASSVGYIEWYVKKYLNIVYTMGLSRDTQTKYVILLEDMLNDIFKVIDENYRVEKIRLVINGVNIFYKSFSIAEYTLIDVIQNCKFKLLNDYIYKYSIDSTYFQVQILIDVEL